MLGLFLNLIDITPTRVMLGLRVSPRKRLQLTENGDKIISSPNEKIAKVSFQSIYFL